MVDHSACSPSWKALSVMRAGGGVVVQRADMAPIDLVGVGTLKWSSLSACKRVSMSSISTLAGDEGVDGLAFWHARGSWRGLFGSCSHSGSDRRTLIN
jgi:hypothetical protein